MQKITQILTKELTVRPEQIQAAVQLLDEGATVPFVARYRKERTGGLSDTQLRELEARLGYLRELEARRESIIKNLQELDKLTPALQKSITDAETKTRLEDLYAPHKPKRETKGQLALQAGFGPLALQLKQAITKPPEELASEFDDPEAALQGARYILIESFAESADLVTELRHWLWTQGSLVSIVNPKQKPGAGKYQDYFDYQEPLTKIPSHRALAILRGRRDGLLRINIKTPDPQYPIDTIRQYYNLPRHPWLDQTIEWTWTTKLYPQLETDCFSQLRERSDTKAIEVFAKNLKDLLLSAPAGQHVTMGLDPGIRTGIKVAVIDPTGKLLDYSTVYLHQDFHASIASLIKLITKHQVSLISIGNGTGSRDTERMVNELISTYKDHKLQKVVVSEAGASVYSASELASKELPDIDVSIRGAVSIARRLQDPLAELVKIEPKAIGVGQYQHDVNQIKLSRSLDNVVEDCVNTVGVDLNTASPALLKYIAGLTESTANNIIEFRNTQGKFTNREELKKIPRLGDKAFEQAAGFLRISNGTNPLDNTAVHPEAYALAEQIKNNPNQSAKIFVSEKFGLPTVKDIIDTLKKPGRDPRPEFKTAEFKPGIETLKDLQPNMQLEGVISNVTPFGAFVNIGVHQDGLVHISELADRFVKDPNEIVKTGDIVKVRVLAVDLDRKRVNLSMKHH